MAVEFSPTEHIFSYFADFVTDRQEAEIQGRNSTYRIIDHREGMGVEAQFILFEQRGLDGQLKQRAVIDKAGAHPFMDPQTASLTGQELDILQQPHERARHALKVSEVFLADTHKKAA